MDVRMLSLGIGAGLLLATLAYGAADSMREEPQAVPQPLAADQRVISQQEWEQELAKAREEGAKQKEAELAQRPPETAAPTTVNVYIQPGMSTTDVALLLQAAGVLEDGNRLIRLRETHPNPIRSGTYSLPLKGDPEQVLKAIATPPRQ